MKGAVIFAVALATRLVAASRVALLDRDGVWYLHAAGRFARGDWKAGLAFHYPPAFPALAALLERLGLDPEPAGLAVSALAGAVAAVLAARLAAKWGERAAWVAGLAFALHPGAVGQGCAVTADGLFATLLLGALLAAQRSRWGAAGLLAAASYLARPEGIVAIPLLALRARRRAPRVLAAAVLLVLPYMAAIRSVPFNSGRGGGEWKLTRKRELVLETGVRAGPIAFVETTADRLVWQTYQLGRAGWDVGAALLVLLAVRRRAPRGWPDLDVALALLLTYSLIRVDERYGLICFTILLPWLGAWLSVLANRRWLLALLLLVLLPFATRPRNTTKVTWRDAGIACTGYSRIAAEDPRVAFYAGVPADTGFLDLHVMTLDEARAKGAQVVAVRDDGPFAESVPRTRAQVVTRPGERVEPVRIVPLQ